MLARLSVLIRRTTNKLRIARHPTTIRWEPPLASAPAVSKFGGIVLSQCAKKTRAFIQAGYVDPENLLFVRERIGEVREAAPKVHEALSTLDEKCAEIFRGHPFYKAPDLAPMLRRLVARTQFTT